MDVVPDGDNPDRTFKKKPDLGPDPTVENELDSDLTPEKQPYPTSTGSAALLTEISNFLLLKKIGTRRFSLMLFRKKQG